MRSPVFLFLFIWVNYFGFRALISAPLDARLNRAPCGSEQSRTLVALIYSSSFHCVVHSTSRQCMLWTVCVAYVNRSRFPSATNYYLFSIVFVAPSGLIPEHVQLIRDGSALKLFEHQEAIYCAGFVSWVQVLDQLLNTHLCNLKIAVLKQNMEYFCFPENQVCNLVCPSTWTSA